MGEFISQTSFTKRECDIFLQKLREETLTLKKLFECRAFEYSEVPKLGLEVEAWLVDKDGIPTPKNKEFLEACGNKDIVEEISKFNFEINTVPLLLESNCFSTLHKQLGKTWQFCQEKAQILGISPVIIGIHPLVRDEMLQIPYMSDAARYEVLNNQILGLRKNKPIALDIKGFDHFQTKLDSILIEAAATSIQVHIQANQENFRRVYNSSLIVSAPCVAIAANSPYLYGHDLWNETRIPLFEQAIALKQFRDKKGVDIGRVSFGTGYIRHSLLEVFLENLNGYPPLVPILFDDKPEELHHLRFHNGTLWRWNRPIIGFNSQGKAHMRVEQRAMASGPSVVDIVANTAFATGLTQFFANSEKIPEESMTFTDCRNNFYEAARMGLAAEVRWFGKKQRLDQLILGDLLPKACSGLENFGVEKAEVDLYLRDIIKSRVLSGQNGANWQRSFVELHGRDFQALAKQYLANQNTGEPVHRWTL